MSGPAQSGSQGNGMGKVALAKYSAPPGVSQRVSFAASPVGHASVQTTERYPGCKQKLNHAVNDNLGVEDS